MKRIIIDGLQVLLPETDAEAAQQAEEYRKMIKYADTEASTDV